jgi:hypothetical protein
MYKIYFEYNTENEKCSIERWYINGCENILVLKQIENALSLIALREQSPAVVLAQEFVDINLNGVDALGAFSKIYMYLAGIVFENLLKGIILQREPDKLNEITKGHELFNLFKLVDVTLSLEDEEFIKRVETYVIWAGRYPHPKVKVKKGHEKGTIVFSDNDIEKVNYWIEKLNAMANYSVWLEKQGLMTQ